MWRCLGTDAVMVTFQPQADLVLDRIGNTQEVEYFTIGDPYPKFTETHPLPADFDWRTAKSVLRRIVFTGDWYARTTDLAIPVAESARHPSDTYYFQGVGWLSSAEVAAGDGKKFTTACAR